MGEADTYGKVSYLVSKEGNVSSAATQYFTLGNGASVEWYALSQLQISLVKPPWLGNQAAKLVFFCPCGS